MQILATVTLATDLLGVKHGLGRHEQFLAPEQVILAKKWISLSEVITNVVTWFVKLSICFFVVRLVKGTQRYLVIGIWFLVALVTVSSLVSVIVFLVQARPIEGIWNPNVNAKRISPFVAIDVAYVSNGATVLRTTDERPTDQRDRYQLIHGYRLRDFADILSLECSNQQVEKDQFADADGAWCSVSRDRMGVRIPD